MLNCVDLRHVGQITCCGLTPNAASTGGFAMARPADDGPTDVYIDVDVDSLADAGVELGNMGTTLTEATDAVDADAVEVLDAIPASDLYNAYAFCWGRWSSVLQDASRALEAAGKLARDAAAGYRATDKRLTPE